MSDFNKFLEKINNDVKKNIICLYYSFDMYACYYYYEDNRFVIDNNPRDKTTEYYKTHVIYRNDEDWFRNEFLVYLNDLYLHQLYNKLYYKLYYSSIETSLCHSTPLITQQDLTTHLNDLSSLLPLVENVNNKELDIDMFVEYVKYYANNILTFEDFKTILYENDIYNDVFADDANMK